MNVDVQESGPVERKLVIEIPTADVDAAFDEVYKGLGKGAKIRGFRPGKVPRGVLERTYGHAASHEVLDRLVQKSLPEAVNDAELDVVGDPRLEPGDPPSQGSAFEYTAVLEIRPEITLAKTTGLEVTRPTLEEPDQDPVEAHIEQQRSAQASVHEESADVPAADGHVAAVDFDATVDGEPFEGGSGKEMLVELGSGRAIPGFEDEIAGLKVGEAKTFDIDFPADYGAEDLAGKTATFNITLAGLKRRELPALDDELAKDISDFDTLDALRADLLGKYEEQRKTELERRTREAVLDAVLEANPFPVPEGVVDRQLQHRLSRALQQFRGLPPEQLKPLVDQWKEEWREAAEREVRLGFLLPEIAKAQEIQVGDDALEAKLAEIAEREGEPVSKIRKAYREGGVMDALHAGLVEERVVEFLTSQASLSDS